VAFLNRAGDVNIDNRLCLVTFLRGNEEVTKAFTDLAEELSTSFGNISSVIFLERPKSGPTVFPENCEQIILPGTKYQRILQLLSTRREEYFLLVDNDMLIHTDNVLSFVRKMFMGGYDIGWGKIAAVQRTGLVPEMVYIDKVLSHAIIRPFLWKMNIGISIPGQCLMFRGGAFAGKLPQRDTFLDDLALGLHIRVNYREFKILYLKDVLGFEHPSESWQILCSQRCRWAKGYAAICISAWRTREIFFVAVHGLSYHANWLLHWAILILFYTIHPLLAVGYFGAVLAIMTCGRVRMLPSATLYNLFFPILHCQWFLALLNEFRTRNSTVSERNNN